MGFKLNKHRILSEAELESLVVTGAGLNIGAMLRKHGAVAGEPCGAVMVTIEAEC